MTAERTSLSEDAGRLHVVPFLLVASAVLLFFGLTRPVLEVQKVAVSVSSYSVLEGIRGLAQGDHLFLALLVGAFSAAFPAAKLFGVAWLWFRREEVTRRHLWLHRLEMLGKWSMLDVYVVCILLGTVNLGFPSGAEPLAGVYWFEAAILASIASTRLAIREAEACLPRDDERPITRLGRRAMALRGGLALAAAASLAVGLTLPILRTEKWHFWDSEYSVFRGITELFEDGYPVLGITVLAFVIVVPLVELGWMGCASLRAARTEELRVPWPPVATRWSMADVFACAVLVVVAKLGDAVALTYLAGLPWLAFGAALAAALSVWPARDPREI